ncbi:MAG: MFS transporter [Bacteroidia bacterium]|nr:MFS transporter [Bacteroidia bacterium]
MIELARNKNWILAIIVFAQFCCTSLWFGGNAIMNDLVGQFGLKESALGHLTSSVQFGFITGTLIFAILTIADRFSPSKVFFFCAIIGAHFNLGMMLKGHTLWTLFGLRFLIGFCLAGIYPVGMKIAADYFDKGLGQSLGLLVGALVLGTAFPHLLKGISIAIPWKAVLLFISLLCGLGGTLILLFVSDGPYRKPGAQLDLSAFFEVFRNRRFRGAAFGYFGHMWELYAFWTFVPVMITTYNELHPAAFSSVSLLSFLIIGIGGLGCAASGILTKAYEPKPIAFWTLAASGICCLLSPLFFQLNSGPIFIVILLFWGFMVVADSPMFSTLVAYNAESKVKGTALTIVNCIGFAITIISIQLLNILRDIMDPTLIYLFLFIGPLFGLWAMWRNGFRSISEKQE